MIKRNLIGLALLGVIVFCVAFLGCGKKANPLNAGTGLGPAEIAGGLPHVSGVFSAANGGSQLNNSDQIVVVFDKPMDPATINTSTITVTAYGKDSGKSGTITYYRETNRAVFAPSSNFVDSSAYVVTVTTGVHDLKGNPLDGNGNNYAESAYDNYRAGVYTAGGVGSMPDLVPPKVGDWGPQGNAVPTSAQIYLRSNATDLNIGTLNTSTITLWDEEKGSQVVMPSPLVWQDSIGSSWALFSGVALSEGTVYRVKASVDIKDNAGNSLDGNGNARSESGLYDEVSWLFCTQITGGTTTPPRVNTPIPRSTGLILTVTFANGPMDIATINSSNIRLYDKADKTGYILGTVRPTFDGNGFTYSLENLPDTINYIWISRNVQNNIGGANGSLKFKLNSNGNSIGGEEGIPAYKFGGPLASDDFFGQVR
jgi:hypothetical protein